VTREGYLRKKGNHVYSYRFKKKYFYLEDHYLKFGSSQDRPHNQIDVGMGHVEIAESQKYKTQFKIIFFVNGRRDKLKLKADNEQDRNQWVESLRKVITKYASNNANSDQFTPGGTPMQPSTGRLSRLWPFKSQNHAGKLQMHHNQRNMTLN